MANRMKDDIITTIKMMRNNVSSVTTRRKDKRTSKSEIYDHLMGIDHIISEEDYLETIQELEDQGIIFKRDGKKYYQLKDENVNEILDTTIESNSNLHKDLEMEENFPSDVSLIDMIKENMLQERLRDKEYIQFLKEEIIFYQSELQEKKQIHRNITK